MVQISKGIEEYDAEMRNGISSKSRAGEVSGKSLSF